VVDVGISKATSSGKVYNLKKLEDFNGNYTAASAKGPWPAAGRADDEEPERRGHRPGFHDGRCQLETVVEGVSLTLEK